MGVGIGKYACVNDECDSSNAMEVYQEEDGTYNAFCYSCQKPQQHNKLASTYLASELGISAIRRNRGNTVEMEKPKRVLKKKSNVDKIITKEQIKTIRDNSSDKGFGFRGINDYTLKYFQVRTEYNEEGDVSNRYYPITQGKDENDKPILVGYHRRIVLPKKGFRAIGLNSKECELFGQWQAKASGRLVLTGGQCDAMAAHQMFNEYRDSKSKGSIAPIDFVSGTVGETSLAAQIRFNYEFIDGYDEIIIDMDDDIKGQEAEAKLLEVLPLAKVKLMRYNSKDANKALEDNKADEYIRAIYNAKKPEVAGVVGSNEVYASIIEAATRDKIELPPFLDSVNKMLGGGLAKKTLTAICAHTSIGKSTYTGQILHHLVTNKKNKCCVLSLEASSGVLGMDLLSLHLKRRLSSFEDKGEMLKFLEDNQDKVNEFLNDEDGNPNFYIIDDRSTLETPEKVFNMVNKMIRGLGVDFILVDVYNDIVEGSGIEVQEQFMSKLKGLVAINDVAIVLICHLRKQSNTKGLTPHDVNEFDVMGSSSLIKSCHNVILLSRDKMASDEVAKNITRVNLTKNRLNGVTGRCEDVYYNWKEHKLYEAKSYLKDYEG